MSFSNDEKVIGFGDIDGQALILCHEDYDILMQTDIPGEKVNTVKSNRETDNFIFGFDYNIKIYDIKGNEFISIELNKVQGSLVDIKLNKNQIFIVTHKGNISLYDLL